MRIIRMLCFEFKKLKRKKFFWILLLVIIMSAVIQALMGKRVYNNVAYGKTFLKIQQPNKMSILEDAELVRDSAHRICDVCESKLIG